MTFLPNNTIKKIAKIVMTILTMRKFSKIDSYYDFSLCNTYTITIFFNDHLKKPLGVYFALAKTYKLRVTPPQGGEGIFIQILFK